MIPHLGQRVKPLPFAIVMFCWSSLDLRDCLAIRVHQFLSFGRQTGLGGDMAEPSV